MKLKSKKDAITQIRRVIEIYNTQRPHSSLEMLTPERWRYAAYRIII